MTKNIDTQEIAKFSELAAHWWDPKGELRTLHAINPLRLHYIQQQVAIADKKIIDLGCGGGILSESLAQAGAIVTGIDMSESALKAAKLHRLEALEQHPHLQLDYQLSTAEEMADKQPNTYDIVTCMEMLEHVPHPQAILKACAKLLKPTGQAFFSTLNRNLKSYLYAIVGAEYILKLLPKNTHDFAKFIRPSELTRWAEESHLSVKGLMGIQYDLLSKNFSLSKDVSVNYLMHAKKC
jgi:2-polyprenyl-6-hydroxyphenyl methylase/3-demethylubiquinone-9 3-methyltransferase